MSAAFDLCILGAGFGGSLLALVARRLGLRVLLLERGSHPRFAIGESTSPLGNLLLEELATTYDLPRLMPLTAYGSWKRVYPGIAVGLKRGFTFYQHPSGSPRPPDPDRARQLLVAASPADDLADTHWYRADFDHFLVREAQAEGVEYVDRVAATGIDRAAVTTTLSGERGGRAVSYQARFVVDATGPRGALSRLLGLGDRRFEPLPPTQALFSHFTRVSRFAPADRETGSPPPYPPDAAALHHLFDGGWMWVLRFDNGISSAGFAAEDWLANELQLASRDAAWERFLDRFPSIRTQFDGAEAVLPLVHAPRLWYRCAQITGPGWALLPSAAAFIDPLFSTGFPLTLLGIHRLGAALRQRADEAGFAAALADYAARTDREAAAAALLVGGCYRSFADFPSFAALSMLYFAAASYAEMARRLGRRELASEFLLQNQLPFRNAFRRHLEAAVAGRPSTPAAIAADLEPFNIAGLCDPEKRNWYDVDLADVVRGAAKLASTREAVLALAGQLGLPAPAGV
jgi:FADH2 O2-dependent halogenase